MIYTYVVNRGPTGVRSPIDGLSTGNPIKPARLRFLDKCSSGLNRGKGFAFSHIAWEIYKRRIRTEHLISHFMRINDRGA